MRKSQLIALDLSKLLHMAQNNGWLMNYSLSTGRANQLAESLRARGGGGAGGASPTFLEILKSY